jgi:hypothetical protein
MNGTIELADALDEAARRLETGEVKYDWRHFPSCNCGVLAQVVLSVDREGLLSNSLESSRI